MNTRSGDLAVLKLGDDATVIDIRAAYRRQAKQCHPDSGGSSQAMIDLTAAAERLLSDEAYDTRRANRAGGPEGRRSSEHAEAPEVPEHPYRRKDDPPEKVSAAMWSDDEFASAFEEPEGLKRVLITFVAFPLFVIGMVIVMILIAT